MTSKFDRRLRTSEAPWSSGVFRWDREPVLTATYHLQVDIDGLAIDVPLSATPICIDGVGVLLVADDGSIRFLREDLSSSFWTTEVGARLYSSPILTHDEDAFIGCADSGDVYAVSLRGSLLWHLTVGQEVLAPPARSHDGETVYITSFEQQLHAVRIADGYLCWTHHLPRPWSHGTAGPTARRDPYCGPIPLSDGSLVIASAEHVSHLDAAGQILWQRDLGATIRSAPCVAPDETSLMVADVSGIVTWIDMASGATRSTHCLGAKVLQSPGAAGDRCVVGAEDGRLTAFSFDSGAVVWQHRTAGPFGHTGVTTTPDGQFVIVNGNGNIEARAADDGAFLWETSQVAGLALPTRIDVTPVISSAGSMMATSYDGVLYRFRFRDSAR